jgi:dihydrolipoamide dehydrogenase
VPKHLVVIAPDHRAGLGSVWRRLGAKVTVVEFLDRITPGMDADPKTFQRALTKQGIEFRLGAVTAARHQEERHPDLEPVAAEGPEPEADYVLLAIGRRPFTDGLGLEASIETDKRGFIPTDHFRTRPGVGHGRRDPRPMLAHKAEGGRLHRGHRRQVRPWTTTLSRRGLHRPEVAWVGKTEEQLKAEGRAYKSGSSVQRQQPGDQPRNRGVRGGPTPPPADPGCT